MKAIAWIMIGTAVLVSIAAVGAGVYFVAGEDEEAAT